MQRRELDTYWRKRDPARTPEPFDGGPARPTSPSTGRYAFVVQQHDATRMHWDVRLEIDGVLVSFAVPRGPNLDGKVKRLAVQTEDHPLEYAHFEGIIPEGNYGAGAMILWDRGSFRSFDGVSPAEQLARGKLDVVFDGLKLKGRWALVRTKDKERGKEGRSWLFFHHKFGGAAPLQPDLTVTYPASILSGLTIKELDEGVDRTPEVLQLAKETGARVSAVDAAHISPMLAETANAPFRREGWVFELKYDGVRAICEKNDGGRVRIFTRQGRDATASFPDVTRALKHLPVRSFVVDGEIATVDSRGVTTFELLQQRLGLTDSAALARAMFEYPACLYAFDLLAVDGLDLRGVPLVERKAILERFVPKIGIVRYADHIESEGEMLFDRVRELGLEGIIAKRARSHYQAGRRSQDWLKVKPERTADLVVVGAQRGRGNPKDLGSLLLAWHKDGELRYAGKVGSGLDGETRARLLPQLENDSVRKAAFAWGVSKPEKGAIYVEPRLVAEVRYTGVTNAGLLRHPVFVRIRDDKMPADCDAPRPAAAAVEPPAQVTPGRAPLKLTNLDKIYFPADGYTKGDLLKYYEEIWPWLQPHLQDRPVVLTRYPDGIDGKNFYQKNAPPFTPEWVETVRIEDTDYFVCNTLESLLYVINSGAIPLHVWHSRKGSLERPDWSVIDLDPKRAPFAHVLRIARHIHAIFDELKVPHTVKTSGQDGMHILLPLDGQLNHVQSRMLAELIARVVVAELPEIATVERMLEARGGKVYVDYGQNGFGRLIAGVFSARPRKGAPVSTPLRWQDVDERLDPAAFTIKTVPARMRELGDPSREVLTGRVELEPLLAALGARMRDVTDR